MFWHYQNADSSLRKNCIVHYNFRHASIPHVRPSTSVTRRSSIKISPLGHNFDFGLGVCLGLEYLAPSNVAADAKQFRACLCSAAGLLVASCMPMILSYYQAVATFCRV